MDTEQKKQIYSKIENLSNHYYLSKGFSFNYDLMEYQKDNQFVTLTASSEHFDSITINPRFRIENSKINEILAVVFPNKIRYNTSRRTQGPSFAHEFGVTDFDNTPYVFIGKYGIKNSIYNYSISMDTDLTPIIEDHINFMEKVGFKYFEALSTVQGINEYFNNRLLSLKEDDFDSEKVMRSFQKEEVLSAIVAAHLEKEEKFDQIIDKYKRLYSEVELYLRDIEKLVEYLKTEHQIK